MVASHFFMEAAPFHKSMIDGTLSMIDGTLSMIDGTLSSASELLIRHRGQVVPAAMLQPDALLSTYVDRAGSGVGAKVADARGTVERKGVHPRHQHDIRES